MPYCFHSKLFQTYITTLDWQLKLDCRSWIAFNAGQLHQKIHQGFDMQNTNESQSQDGMHALISCPCCKSQRLKKLNYGKRTGGTIGTIAGAVAGGASLIGGAELGATVGLVSGPFGIVIGGFAGALLGALVGGATGCSVGSKLGAVVDDRILDNFQCLDCDYSFSQ